MSDNNKKIILTFDVELWTEGSWLKPHITEDLLKIDTFPNSIRKILLALKNHSGFATFFVTLEVTEKHPEIIKEISDQEHEIGIHGPKHIKLKDYLKSEFKNDLIRQIDLMEKITGKKPKGYRAPHFSLTKETYWALEILKELGFTYDSSIFPKNMGEYGDSKSPKDSYEIIPTLTEIPVSVSSLFGQRFPYAGGIYFRMLPLWIFKFFLNKELKTGKPVIYFHPHELDNETPKIKKGPYLRRLLKYWGTDSSFKKFEKILNCYIVDSITH